MGKLRERRLLRKQIRMLNKTLEERKIEWTEKQLEVIECQDSNIIMSGGYGSGKTIVGLHKFFLWIEKNPMDAMCLGFSAETMRKRLREYFNRESAENIVIGKNINEFSYKGAIVHIFGSDSVTQSSRIRSLNLSYLYCDEPTTNGFLQEAYLEALSRIRTGDPKIMITTNPSYPSHWVKTDVVDNPSFHSFSFSTFDNPHLFPSPAEYIQNMGMQPETPRYRQYVLGEWVESGYELFLIEKDHMTQEKVFNSYAWIDISYSLDGDNTALAVASFRERILENGRREKYLIIDGYLFQNRTFLLKAWDDIHKKHQFKEVYYDASLDAHLQFQYELLEATSPFERNFRVTPFTHETVNKEAKIASHISWALGNKKIFFTQEIQKEFLDQIKQYRGESMNRKLKLHDDAPDALACLIRELRTPRKTRINNRYAVDDVLS